jgi:glycosyltransferase involved in cell wall biosynthesis
MTACDILFCSHNRRAFTEASFSTLLANTDWNLVGTLHIRDDNSTDGCYEWLLEQLEAGLPVKTKIVRAQFGGPVASMNDALSHCKSEILAKIDSDTIVPPGWLGIMLTVMDEHQHLDALGFEPGFAEPVAPARVKRAFKVAAHIGGQGLFKTRCFTRRRPSQHERYFGMTQFMRKTMQCAWIDPDIAAFNLDHLPFEPWRSLAEEYVTQGFSRPWSSYDRGMSAYWDWWIQEKAAVA